jgi:hypothetical protein
MDGTTPFLPLPKADRLVLVIKAKGEDEGGNGYASLLKGNSGRDSGAGCYKLY